MKKQILTLTMCLALTTTAALADGINTVTQKAIQQTKVTTPAAENQAKRTASIITKAEDQSKSSLLTREEAKKHFEEREAKKRELMYKNLGFSDEQKAKADALGQKTKQEGAKTLKKVQTEAIKLRDLKNKKASKFAIWKQELALNSAKKEAKTFFESSRKAFEGILTKEQKIKMEEFKKSHKPQGHKGEGAKGPHGPKHMGPPPEGMEPKGPNGPKGPEPMGPPPGNKK